MGISNSISVKKSRKVTQVEDATKACNIGYSLWSKSEWEDSKNWFLRALELGKNNTRATITANRFLGWLSVRPNADGLLNPIGTLSELLYACKYWLQVAVNAEEHESFAWSSQAHHDWSLKQKQIWFSILHRFQHNQKILLGYWVQNCELPLQWSLQWSLQNIMEYHEFEAHKIKLHGCELIRRINNDFKLYFCDICRWGGLRESFSCQVCDFDVCMACYYKLDKKYVVYKTLYEYSNILYGFNEDTIAS
jgi:hypothetical protein